MNITNLNPKSKIADWLYTINSIIDYIKSFSSLFVSTNEYNEEIKKLQNRISNLESKHKEHDDIIIKNAKNVSQENIISKTQINNILSDIKNTDSKFKEIRKTIEDSVSSTKQSIDNTFNTKINSLKEEMEKYSNANAHLFSKIEEIKTKVINLIYPIGSVYISIIDINPESIFGGDWERIEDTFLIGAGNLYTNGSTGGSTTHTLSINNLPSHKHEVSIKENGDHAHKPGNLTGQYRCYKEDENGKYIGSLSHHIGELDDFAVPGSLRITTGLTEKTGKHTHAIEIKNSGNGESFNIIPPYTAVYIWKRIA